MLAYKNQESQTEAWYKKLNNGAFGYSPLSFSEKSILDKIPGSIPIKGKMTSNLKKKKIENTRLEKHKLSKYLIFEA